MKSSLKNTRLAALFTLLLLLLNFPLIEIANRPLLIGGIPLLYLYVFGLWFLFIFLLIPFGTKPPR